MLIGLVGKKKKKYLWIWKFLDGDWNALNTSKRYHTSSPMEIGLLFVVQSLSRDRLFATPWTVARQTPLCIGLRMLVIGIYSAKIQEKNHITVRILYTWGRKESDTTEHIYTLSCTLHSLLRLVCLSSSSG